MEQLGPGRVDEPEVYREHNDPLHETLTAFDGMMDVLPQLRAEGRRLGIVTAKRHRTVALAFARFPGLPSSSSGRRTRRHRSAQARSRPRPRGGREGAEPADAAYVGDSPFDIRAAKAAGAFAVAVSWGGIHKRRDAAGRGAGCLRPRAGRAALCPLGRSRRPPRSGPRSPAPRRASPLPLPRPRRPELRCRLRRALRRATRDRGRASRARHLRLTDAARLEPRRRKGSARSSTFSDGVTREGDDGRALAKWADDIRKRLGSEEAVAYVLEPKIDGSARPPGPPRERRLRGATRGDGLRGEDVTGNLVIAVIRRCACEARTAPSRRPLSRCAARSTSRPPGSTASTTRRSPLGASLRRMHEMWPRARCASSTSP